MDSDNVSTDKIDFVQDAPAVIIKNVENKPTPPTTPSPSPVSSISGSTDAQTCNLQANNKILGHNYNGTGMLGVFSSW